MMLGHLSSYATTHLLEKLRSKRDTDDTKCWQEYRVIIGPLIHFLWEYKIIQPCWKMIWLNIHFTI